MDIKEVARKGGRSRSERKLAAVRENIKKAQAAKAAKRAQAAAQQ